MVRYGFPSNTNKVGSKPKIRQDDYIETNIEPFDSEIDNNMSAEIEAGMAETIYDMRREFKRQNKKIMKLYSSKEPKNKFYELAKPKKIQQLLKKHSAA